MAGLLDKRLWVVSGKGGVGKSLVSSALALAAVRKGKRVLVAEVNATERLSGLLGHERVGAEVRQVSENLWAVNVKPEEALHEYALLRLKSERIYRTVFGNRFVRYFLRFLPSIQETVMLGKILFHVKEEEHGRPRFDVVIIDAPATGHAISFLGVPRTLAQTVPPGPLADEAKWMREMVEDPARTAAVLVALPEEMPVNETIELVSALSTRVGMRSEAVLLNHSVAQRFGAEERGLLLKGDALGNVIRAHTDRADATDDAEARLKKELSLPVHRLPRLYAPEFERAAVETISGYLDPLLEGRS